MFGPKSCYIDESKAIFDGQTWHYNWAATTWLLLMLGPNQELHLHFVNKHLVYLCFVDVAHLPLENFELLMAHSYSEASSKLTTS
jgi:hypothetical protein